MYEKRRGSRRVRARAPLADNATIATAFLFVFKIWARLHLNHGIITLKDLTTERSDNKSKGKISVSESPTVINEKNFGTKWSIRDGGTPPLP
ncbi:hypothetical protein EVAR_75855_1 [Eumeta japonica]|uniref:Uncharacterized protein n=1 Tax=Eumeta variegata TaxID=151549 RepID=A0A4C1TE76_EUMVA|nr:hypothetical protein EVAR_75855_1 [Eumeta japonica]